MSEYISTTEVASQLHIPLNLIQLDIRHGLLQAQKDGSTWKIPASEVPSYLAMRERIANSISIDELTRRVTGKDSSGHHKDRIKQAIQDGELIAPRYGKNKNAQYYILETDAKEFCQRVGWPYTIPPKETSLPGQKRGPGRPPGSTTAHVSTIANNGHINNGDTCDACGSRRGNIIGDMNKTTHERYGFLCTECHRLLVASNANIDRLHKLLTYIEKTRESQVYLVHK